MAGYFFDLIRADLADEINEAGRLWVNAMAHQIVDETWEPQALSGVQRKTFNATMVKCGVDDPETYVGTCFLGEYARHPR